MKRSELIQSVVSWNNRFPLDRWWRIKYNIPFMSPAHRESSFINQLIEFEEDKLFLQIHNKNNVEEYIPGVGDFLKSPKTLKDFAEEAQREIKELLKLEENASR